MAQITQLSQEFIKQLADMLRGWRSLGLDKRTRINKQMAGIGPVATQFRILDDGVKQDHFECKLWDGENESGPMVKVAKVFLLRKVDSRIVFGVEERYSNWAADGSTRDAEKGVEPDIETVNEAVKPSYQPGDVIYAFRLVNPNTATKDGDEPILFVDAHSKDFTVV